MACASFVSPIEIFAADEVGRRRHWSDEDKIRIVEESLRSYRQGSATARRYGISRSLLSLDLAARVSLRDAWRAGGWRGGRAAGDGKCPA